MSAYGSMARFDGPERLLTAARAARAAGFVRLEAFGPFRVEGLAEAVGASTGGLRGVVLVCGIAGAVGGYFMQYWSAVRSYPLDVAGRALHSWPAFVPITFELTILSAAAGAVLGMLLLNGLPLPYHPVFNVTSFASGGWYLLVRADDPRHAGAFAFFQEQGAQEVSDVAG